MNVSATKAIVLKTTPYKEKDQIIQAFTLELGVQSFYVKRREIALPSMIEIQYKKRGSIPLVLDCCVLKDYENTRADFSTIKACGKILNYTYKTQLPGKTSPSLFYFLDRLLSWINRNNALVCLSLFFIKFLKYEGSFTTKTYCNICKKELNKLFTNGQYWLCNQHKSKELFSFTKEEINTLTTLEKEKTKQALCKLQIDQSLCQTIEQLFCNHFELT